MLRLKGDDPEAVIVGRHGIAIRDMIERAKPVGRCLRLMPTSAKAPMPEALKPKIS